jgi:hypothetical protein
MDGSPRLDPRERARLRRLWLQRASTAFEEMFDSQRQDALVTFTQREQMACSLGKELSRWLLEQHVTADPQVRPALETPPLCPKCSRPGQRVTKPDKELPQRQLTTAAGEVTLQREQWRCTTCRVVFFPSGPTPATGDRGLQSAVVAEGGSSSRPGLLPGSQ